ncbi:Uncharacterised protein [Nocardia africana]|uniref:Uncharacterized protein n=1 Tax=Nocardia africana TaxID=134964 RepID=A0A378WWJ6_9NOCA|nr:Uncharacterised protein [Nocardia africana]
MVVAAAAGGDLFVDEVGGQGCGGEFGELVAVVGQAWCVGVALPAFVQVDLDEFDERGAAQRGFGGQVGRQVRWFAGGLPLLGEAGDERRQRGLRCGGAVGTGVGCGRAEVVGHPSLASKSVVPGPGPENR